MWTREEGEGKVVIMPVREGWMKMMIENLRKE